MSQRRISFQLEWRAGWLILRGDLDGDAEVQAICEKVLAKVPGLRRKYIVDAINARIVPEGVTIWIAAVSKHLPNTRLHYRDCQLADVLQMGTRYKHPKSTFEPSDLIVDPHVSA